jgi:hypothetical protein
LGLGPSELAISSREGITVLLRFKGHREYIKLRKAGAAVSDWLAKQGVNNTQSDAGRISEEIFNSLDGFIGAGLIANEETVKLNTAS